jgi:iron complex outermembrane receptor protein
MQVVSLRFLLPLVLALGLAGPVRAQERLEESEPGQEDDANEEVIDVAVHGARMRPPVSPRDPTAASTVISGHALRSPGRSTAEVLAQAPGVQVARTGSGADLATASVRGATSAQTPVLLAGIPLNDDVAGTADLSVIPLWMIDRVEVYRGHAPGFVGQLGIGGVVLFEPRLPKRSGVGVGQTLGSFGEVATWMAGSVKSDGAATLVALQHARAHNDYPYTDDGGTRFDAGDDERRSRDNADFVANDVWLVSRHDLGVGSDVTVLGNVFDREQGATGLAVIPARHARASVRRALGGLTARTPCARPEHGEVQGPCTLTLSSSAVLARTLIDDPLGELSLPSTRLSTHAVRFTQQGQVQHRIGDAHEVGILGSQAVERLSVDPDGLDDLHAARYTSRLAATTTLGLLPTASLHAIAGAECHTTEGPGTSSTCGVLEPYGRVGASWLAVPWLSVLGNVGRYVRPPTLGELYGTSPTVRGTPTLTSEAGTSVDAGVRVTRQGDTPDDLAGYVEVFAFTRWVTELVAFQRTSFGVVRPFNVGAARVAGLEVASGAVWLDHLANELVVTLLDPRDTTEDRTLANDILPFQSRMVLSNRIEVFSEPALPSVRLDRVALGVRVQHRSSRFADPAGLIVIEPHTTIDLEVGSHFLERSVAARLALRNLLDRPQFDTVGYPLPGRSYHANVEAWF